ncbi:hypothetical protein E2562_010318 [Oryza meyeriana var. granulata]|uniref:F-box protein AT5G49610-like beta-propeller domain-containing protein n=1 Tax=Oryza meyeriana var. granulata TaxID=110450 RepID=A0A6G1F6C1_9ORYZ|nr:hypothetical protein E2562_010318 [Oryza meyeriana var. granulata]
MRPQAPELSSVLHRAMFGFGPDKRDSSSTGIVDCRKGSVLVSRKLVTGVHRPLRPEGGTAIVLLPPIQNLEEDTFHTVRQILSKEDGNELLYFGFTVEFNEQGKATAHVYVLEDGGWHIHTSATPQLPELPILPPESNIVLSGDKIYMPNTVGSILVLDLTSTSFIILELPDGVRYDDGDIMLSRRDDCGVYLILLKEFQLRIWLHKGGSGSVSDWLLVDTFRLRKMCATMRMPNCTTDGASTFALKIIDVGDNAEFVFLEMGKSAVYLDIKSTELQKVYKPAVLDSNAIPDC